jgi:ATP-binding cassette subfamily B protein
MTQSRRKNAMHDVLVFLFSHWRHEARVAIAVACSMIVATAADLLMPIFSGRLVDAIALSVSPASSRAAVLPIVIHSIAIMAALGLVLMAGRHLAMLGIIRLTLRTMSRMAADAFWRVQRFSTDWQANHFGGAIVRRITRGMWAVDLMNDTLLLALLPALFVLAGSAILLALRWPSMGLLVAVGAICYVVLSVALSLGYVAPAARLSNAQDTRVGAAMADSITCNTVVKGFGAESREDFRLSRVLEKWTRRTRRTWIFGTNSGSLQLIVLLTLRALVVGYAALLWWQGRASAGDVTFVITSYFLVHGYLRDVGQHVANLQRSVNEMEEMVAFHSQPLGIADRTSAQPVRVSAGEIVFDQVTFRYGAHVDPLFRSLSVRIRAGERVGLVGHSGSGKTTFVKLLHRLYDVSGGHILIDGQDVAFVTQDSLRAQLALVPQEPILFHRSLAENIAYARPEASMREIEHAARLANAHHFIARQPKGYATPVGERGVKLSGGERQRVALARAFLADTPVLILDEATSSLDSESEALIQEAMERLMAGRTSIVIAHRLSTVRMLDRILVFDNGEIIEEGKHDDLVQRTGGTYRRLFEKQAMGLLVDNDSDSSQPERKGQEGMDRERKDQENTDPEFFEQFGT